MSLFSNISSDCCALFIERNRNCLAARAKIARSVRARMVGLLPYDFLQEGEGLVLLACQSIHTAFMKFTIDAVFIDAAGLVVRLFSRLPPWRITPLVWRTYAVIELPAGIIHETEIREGDHLLIQSI